MFGTKKSENKNEKKISSFNYSFRFDDKYLYFKGIGLDGFRIFKNDIESVSVDANTEKWPLQSTYRLLKINGNGTLLGQAKIDKGFAEKAQDFILEEIKNNPSLKNQTVSSISDEIEKLFNLKVKGIITEEEFNKKKAQLLSL